MKLFQETWRHRPFWMLVGCILVNRATWAKAEPILTTLVQTYRTPTGLREADPVLLSGMLKPLGFHNIRASRLINLSFVWSRHGHRYWSNRTANEIKFNLPGCGDYAADSWAIFVKGTMTSPRVGMDKKLRKYLEEHT